MKQSLSVVIITLNAGSCLAACLQSVRWSDEIVIVDAGSTDDTLAIAVQFGARVITEPWRGFGRQKQFAVELARHDWVLCVDADERVSDELAASVERVLTEPSSCGYRMARCNRFLGRWLRHGEGYPDWNLRLFDRRRGRWADVPVHEHVVVDGEVGTLKGDLLHESQESLASYLDKQNRYTSLQAQRLFEQGVQSSVFRLVMSPWLRFIKFYVLRGGFRDGVAGLVHIAVGCFNSFIKYAKLLELNRTARVRAP